MRAAVGVGHSMGGHAMTEAAAAEPRCFRRLVLIDPVIGAPEAYAAGSRAAFAERRIRRRGGAPDGGRPRRCSSVSAIAPPFDTWDPAVLRDYVAYGLVPAPDGDGWVLGCAPEFEADVYMARSRTRVCTTASRPGAAPVLVVRAQAPPARATAWTSAYSPTWPGLAAAFPNGREIHLPERTHFVPMEDPAQIARWILDG